MGSFQRASCNAVVVAAGSRMLLICRLQLCHCHYQHSIGQERDFTLYSLQWLFSKYLRNSKSIKCEVLRIVRNRDSQQNHFEIYYGRYSPASNWYLPSYIHCINYTLFICDLFPPTFSHCKLLAVNIFWNYTRKEKVQSHACPDGSDRFLGVSRHLLSSVDI